MHLSLVRWPAVAACAEIVIGSQRAAMTMPRACSACNKDAAVTIHVSMRFCSLDLANPSCALDPRPRRASFLGAIRERCALMIIIEVGSRRRRHRR